ncbi:MAG TPA: maleylpyruvate isomerase family mycothiol-dependent enzyme [Streptosporangiaceae bacterium]
METSPGPWIVALRHSHDRLEAIVEPLDPAQLEHPAYPSKWSIAQVLSHLGSQAEIFGLWLDSSLSGTEPPGRETFGPIWDSWNARSPQAQTADGLRADRITLERMESLDADQLAGLHLNLFGTDLDAVGLGRMRVSEHSVHTWDVAVALDPAATLAPDAVGLLVDTLGQFVARAAKPDGVQRRLCVSTTDPEREFILETSESVTLTPADRDEDLPELRLPAEAFIRLLYGRLDPAHTPAVRASGVDLDELRLIFPGI